MRLVAIAAILVGCSGASVPSGAPDLARMSSDGAQLAPEDLANDPDDLAGADLLAATGDMSTAAPADLSKPADLSMAPPDLSLYPGCGGPGLPTGASCANNTQCCHGLCGSATNMPPYKCCFAIGTLCAAGSDCCSGACSASKSCL